MTTYNTGNPVGSVDVRDLYDNAQNLDNFSNGTADKYADRFGVSRQSLQGIRNASQYVDLGPYAAGLMFTSRNQVFSYLGEFYAPGPSITLPYTTTGVGAAEIANFRSVGDATLRADLASDSGADLVYYKPIEAGAYKISLGKAMQYNALPSVLDFMTDAERFAVTTDTWTTVADVSAACQLAMDTHTAVSFPGGVYKLAVPLHLKNPKQCIFGHGSGETAFQPAATFTPATIGGVLRSAMVVYQPLGLSTDLSTSVIGGVISDLTINCANRLIDGVVFNRVNQAQTIRDVHMYRPRNGIINELGWCHLYTGVYIQGASLVSISLKAGSNGTTINGCLLYGFDYSNKTQVHIDVSTASIGNSVSGGAIELCEAGVRVAYDGQISIDGTDFEACAYRFIESTGLFSGPTLVKAGLASTATGCSFVGVPNGGGVVSDGAGVALMGCSFINNDPVPTGTDEYALWGVRSGQEVQGLLGAGISATNCAFQGWGARVTRGQVVTVVLGKLSAEDVEVPVKTWSPSLVNFTTTGTVVISDAYYVKTGKLVYFTCKISATTIATTGFDSNVAGLPHPPAVSNTAGIISALAAKPSTALVQPNGNIYPPTDAAWGSTMVISGTYLAA